MGCPLHPELAEEEEEGVTSLLKSRDPHLAGGENHTIGRLHSHLRLRVLDSHPKGCLRRIPV